VTENFEPEERDEDDDREEAEEDEAAAEDEEEEDAADDAERPKGTRRWAGYLLASPSPKTFVQAWTLASSPRILSANKINSREFRARMPWTTQPRG